MKKELFIPLILTIFVSLSAISLCSSSLVYAQSGTSVEDRLEKLREKRQEIIDNHQAKMEELRLMQGTRQDEIAQKIASREALNRERTITRIKLVFTHILDRFNAALARLDKIAKRIASRIDKLKAKGVNTSGAEAALLAAEKMGSAAAVAIDNAKSQIKAIDASSSTVPDAVHAAINAVRDAKQALKGYHKALVEAIKQLKAANALREGSQSAH